jgi:uncharacterized phage protein (TIGR02218 family)
MRAIPPALQAKLDAGVTTLCACWVITRRDDVTLGFTSHDRDLIVEGVVCHAASGLIAGAAETRAGLAAGLGHVSGALDSDVIAADDIDAGLYDGASVVSYQVDWSDPSLFVRTAQHTVRSITRTPHGFAFDLAGPMAALDRVVGRVFARACDAVLGDGRCGVDITAGGWSRTATVTRVLGPARFEVSGVDDIAAGFFTLGQATVAGENVAISSHTRDQGTTQITLEQAVAVTVGQGISLRAGCDKRLATCRDRFANAANFRGCPHMPGDDFIMGYPAEGETHDGGSRTGS